MGGAVSFRRYKLRGGLRCQPLQVGCDCDAGTGEDTHFALQEGAGYQGQPDALASLLRLNLRFGHLRLLADSTHAVQLVKMNWRVAPRTVGRQSSVAVLQILFSQFNCSRDVEYSCAKENVA